MFFRRVTSASTGSGELPLPLFQGCESGSGLLGPHLVDNVDGAVITLQRLRVAKRKKELWSQ